MVSEQIKRMALNAGAIASNNLGGFVYSFKDAQGNYMLDNAFNGVLASVGVVGDTAKIIKTLIYDAGALAAMELSNGKSEAVQIAGTYGAEFLKGIGTSTVAADPAWGTAPNAPVAQVQAQAPAVSRRMVAPLGVLM